MFFCSVQARTSLLKVGYSLSTKLRTYATRKRFYKATSIVQSDKKWEVTLDHRRLKTPGGKVFAVNSEPLARAIAAEWDAQSEVISQPTMHLTALCNTALDNPGKLTEHDIANYLLDYVSTDTLLFHSDDEEELLKLQKQKWQPILDWFSDRFGVRLASSSELLPVPISADVRAVLARHFLSYDFPSLNALCFGVEALKSIVLMLACVERRLEPSEAVLLARLEEEYQALRWGHVQWAHGLSQADLTSRVSAAALVMHCSVESHFATVKKVKGKRAAQ